MTYKLNPASWSGNSPHFHVLDDDTGTLLVQGYVTGPDNHGVDVDTGEDTVTVPALLAVDAAAALDSNGMNRADLSRMLEVFASSAFHMETRAHYSVEGEDEALARWQATGELPGPDHPGIADWNRLVSGHVARGRDMSRVHVVRHPLSDYLRLEFAVQETHSIPAGERVGIVDADAAGDQLLIDRLTALGDFWLFDNRVGVRMIFDDGGQLTGVARMTNDEVEAARVIRDDAWAAAGDLAAETVGVR